MRKTIIIFFLVFSLSISCLAQFRYRGSDRLTIGSTDSRINFSITARGKGFYFHSYDGRFFSMDITPSSPRIAGGGNTIEFYNSQTSVYNSIQVSNVYTHSDALAKKNILPFNRGSAVVANLNPVLVDAVKELQQEISNVKEALQDKQ